MGFLRALREGEYGRVSGVHLQGMPPGCWPGRDLAEPQANQSSVGKPVSSELSDGGYWREFKILAISQVILFAKRRVWQPGHLLNSRLSCWTALRTFIWNAGHLCQSSPSHSRTSPSSRVLGPCNDKLFQCLRLPLGLISFPLYLWTQRGTGLLWLPVNGLSTYLARALLWRSVIDLVLCPPGHLSFTLFSKDSPSHATVCLKPLIVPCWTKHTQGPQEGFSLFSLFLPVCILACCLPCLPSFPIPGLTVLLYGWCCPWPSSVDCFYTLSGYWVKCWLLGNKGYIPLSWSRCFKLQTHSLMSVHYMWLFSLR